MSKLADKIRSAGRVAPAPIGFGIAMERRASPTLLCLLRLDKNQVKSVGDAAAAAWMFITRIPSTATPRKTSNEAIRSDSWTGVKTTGDSDMLSGPRRGERRAPDPV